LKQGWRLRGRCTSCGAGPASGLNYTHPFKVTGRAPD
jgi:hypothetical protein